MNIYINIAKRFLSSGNNTGKFTSIISIVGICIGSFALVISISVLNGFENKLDEKISNFDEAQAEILTARFIQKITTQFVKHLKEDETSVAQSLQVIQKVFQS